ncbi:MAG: molybdopterin-guanine dinucleotide biosynthesis protein B [Bacillota bacterium]|jgi:molybdopterin-guanine dinucleotide biosynthesis protein MobB
MGQRSVVESAGGRVPLFSVVGASNSGKSTLLIKLVQALKNRGYRVAVIKHSRNFEVDQPGKDSWRYRAVGAGPVILAGPEQMVLFRAWEKEWEPEEIAQSLTDVDLVITEGYKKGKRPKIEVFREDNSRELICPPEDLIAVVSDVNKDWGVPVFDLEQIKELADFVEARFLKR